MTLGVACFLRHVFSDCFNAEKSRLKEVRSRNKSAHRIIVGYLGAVYTSIVLGNHPVPPRQVGFVRLAVIRLEAPGLNFLLLKPAFKKASTTMIAFNLKEWQHHLTVPRQGKGNGWHASCTASTLSLTILRNDDVTNTTFFSLCLSFTAANKS